jgi:hypothetical protein
MESFDVAPNFSRSSSYAHHLARAHRISLSAGKSDTQPWVCTLDGCRSQKATSEGVLDPVIHIRTHLGHRDECPDCHTTLSRRSSLKRHREKYCESEEKRARKRTATLHGDFDCPDCHRRHESADTLFYHCMMGECVAGSSG